MDLDRNIAAEIAKFYFSTEAALVPLGWGVSGYVYLSPDLLTAVKVHRYQEGFERELETYLMLRRVRITNLHGLTIPKLRDYRTDLKLIKMDFVKAPYLLDFAGTRFDPPDFDDDVMERWHADLAEMFGPNVSLAYAVYHSLAKHGIYYVDFRPSNMKLDGLPGLQPFEAKEPDDA